MGVNHKKEERRTLSDNIGCAEFYGTHPGAAGKETQPKGSDAMADVKWVKITTDMFDNRKIKHLRKLPEGNNIVLIWVMLLTMAGRCNAGGMIFLTENIPYTTKMLADELGFEENTVKLALQMLEQFSMITTDNGCFTIAGWNEYQNIDGMDKIREQNRLRKAAQRARQKEAMLQLPESCDSHGTVTQSHATDKDKEEDIKNKNEESIYTPVITYLNEKAGTKFKPSSSKTREKIDVRVNDGYTLDDFKTVIDKKCADWLGDAKMCKFLRPETLFGPKFEGYLNEINGNGAGYHGNSQGNYRTLGEKVGTYL
jgi:predicted phage replisome organizer/uncharacterized phage protein (TIGR02220 family)